MRVFVFGAGLGVLLLLAGPARAACVDDPRFEQAVKEAREKARAFRAQKERQAAIQEERQAASSEIKQKKARQSEELEEIRRQYVEERNRRPSLDRERERMEREWEERRAEKSKAVEMAGAEYAKFQRCLRQALKDGDSLDPAEEFDARSRRNPNGENLKRTPPPDSPFGP